MKNVFIRFIALMLCVPFILGLVACNGSGDAKTEPGTTTAESPDPTDPTPTDTDPTPTDTDPIPTETEPAGTTGGEDEPTDPAKGPLDGKRVIFIGNSYVYYGQSVLSISKSTLKQPPRENDQGYFYQMCKAYGSEVNVTNWTFGSHALYDLFGGDCTINGCTAGNHEKYLTNRYYDYVFVSPSGGTTSEARIAEDFDYIINFFKAANPNVKIVCLGNLGCRGYSSWGLDLPGIYNYYKTLEEKGVIIADWGGIVKGLIDGKYTIDGSKETYSAKSFIVKDGYHPNQLAGYITTLTAYCAITGESAVGKTYDFCNNTAVHSRFSFSSYISEQYNNASDTNYPAIFASKTDMEGIQKLVDKYLTEKPYLNIETPKEDETTTKGPLDGKRVIFIGNSYIYYGYSCLGGSASTLDQSKRENDRGYFYQLCKAYGSEVNVTNWTAASHSLADFFGGKCSRSDCKGKDHTASLTNAYYDYVFVAPSGGKQAEADNLLTDFDNITKFFTAANPNVKIVCLGNLGAHGYSSTGLALPDMIKSYKTLEEKGVIIADYGSIIDDIIDGKVAVPGATQTYNKNSFILKNGYNPNLLTGYITTLMAYCAITGESAVGKTYAFCNDSSINTKFNFDTYVGNNYSSTITTNFPAIFASESDMKGIQELIDKYLAEKPYRNITDTETDTDPEVTPTPNPDGVSLEGKRVIFIGHSYLYYGYSCVGYSPKTLTQAERENDTGYFYQLCKKQGYNVNVTNWTATSHTLSDFFGGACSRSDCKGKDHRASLTNAYYDYVFVAPGGGKQSEADNMPTDFDNIIKFFTAANPNVKIVCLGNLGAYGYSSTGIELPDMIKYYKTLESKGVIIADYGTLIDDIIDGKVAVPGATQTYNKNSFILKNGYNPNLLTGYITTLMAYCAITGESAVGLPYDFCNDSSLNTKFNFDTYVSSNYSSTVTTNFPAIFASESDMKGIQELIDKYLAEKPYRNYN